MKFKILGLLLLLLVAGLNACQSNKPISEEAVIDNVAAETKKQQDSKDSKEPNPVKCQQAKLDLVEIESTQDIPQINQAKAAIMRYCDNIE